MWVAVSVVVGALVVVCIGLAVLGAVRPKRFAWASRGVVRWDWQGPRSC